MTEWSNRTFYFGDDVTSDIKLAAAKGSDGLVALGVELWKHWFVRERKPYASTFFFKLRLAWFKPRSLQSSPARSGSAREDTGVGVGEGDGGVA